MYEELEQHTQCDRPIRELIVLFICAKCAFGGLTHDHLIHTAHMQD